MEIRSIAVLGAGQMGNGIAQTAACAGYEVTMIDIEQSFVERGMAAIEGSLSKLVAKERMSREDADSALARGAHPLGRVRQPNATSSSRRSRRFPS